MKNKNRGAFHEKKKWLASYQELIEEIEVETTQAGYWQDKAISLTAPQLSLAPAKSAEKITMPDCVVNFLDIAKHCSEMADLAHHKKAEICEAINSLDDPDCRQLLKMHYIGGKNFLEIAETMHYTVRWIKKIHNRALSAIEMPKECPRVHLET